MAGDNRKLHKQTNMALRITGGRLRGRRIRTPTRGVRPTQDRVREGVFSSLAGVIPGARVLDIFAGSGALGIEALSRGGSFVCWVESDRKVFSILTENVRNLCEPVESGPHVDGANSVIPQTHVVMSEAIRFLRGPAPCTPFDIIFADPPYDTDGTWLKKLLLVLSGRSMLKQKGIFIMESRSRIGIDDGSTVCEGWVLIQTRFYGDTQITVFQKNDKQSSNK